MLGRTDLGELLEDRIEKLDRNDYTTAQTLAVLHELSKNPEQTLPWRPTILADDKPEYRPTNEPTSWKDIVKDDPLPLDADYWQSDLDSANDDLSEQDESFGSDSEAAQESHASISQSDEQDMNMEQTSLSDATEDTDLQDRLSKFIIPPLETEYNHLYSLAFWNQLLDSEQPELPTKPIVIEESTAIREAIFALRGSRSPIIMSKNVQISTMSRRASLDILKCFKTFIDKIAAIRIFFEIPGAESSPLSVFGAALESVTFKELNQLLGDCEVEIINFSNRNSKSANVITVFTFLERLRRVSLPWSYLAPVVLRLAQSDEENDAIKFSNLLQELYNACNGAFLAVAHEEFESDVGSSDSYCFNQTLLVFYETFKHYGSAIEDWMKGEDTGLFVKDHSSDTSLQLRHFWEPRYSASQSRIPPFLNPALCQQIYEAGLSIQLFKLVNKRTFLHPHESPPQSFFSTIFSLANDAAESTTSLAATANMQEWWTVFHSHLDQWVGLYHEHNNRLLMCRLNQQQLDPGAGTLLQSLARYISTYFMADVAGAKQFSATVQALEFRYSLFEKLQEVVAGTLRQMLPDKYVVQDDFEESVRKSRLEITEAGSHPPQLVVVNSPTCTAHWPGAGESNGDDGSNEALALGYVSRLKLAYPTPWVVKEVVRDHATVYQEVWVVLQQWAWARHIVTTLHLENMGLLRQVQRSGTAEESEQVAALCLATHTALVFVNGLSQYLHDAVLKIRAAEFVGFVSVGSANTGPDIAQQQPQPPHSRRPDQTRSHYRPFQAIVDEHQAFLDSVSDLFFLTRCSSGDAGQARVVYIAAIQKSLSAILFYCCVTLVRDRGQYYAHTNLETFGKLVGSFRKSVRLALDNFCFAEKDAQIIQRFLRM